MLINRRYGYLSSENDGGFVKMVPGQNIAGYSVGILYLEDVYYPMLPGNVVNANTYDFPVRLKAVKGLDNHRLFEASPDIYSDILAAAKELQKEGVRAISAACGFFGIFQKNLANDMDIPVAVSSLVQLPWISSIIGQDKKVGVLTASIDSITDNLLESCGIQNKELFAIKGLGHLPHFSAIIENRGEFDNTAVKQEVVSSALELYSENPDIGAILLECSDMPPYASLIQQELQLPVFDFITLIRWLHCATTQKPYSGTI